MSTQPEAADAQALPDGQRIALSPDIDSQISFAFHTATSNSEGRNSRAILNQINLNRTHPSRDANMKVMSMTRHTTRTHGRHGRKIQSNLRAAPIADPENPYRVQRSHLEKIELGKSSSSCKVSFVTRLHRNEVLQEFWCASWEEACVYQNLAGHPDVVNFKEQLTRVDYVNGSGRDTHTTVDAHVLLRDGSEVLVSVKYDEKSKRKSYLAEVEGIAAQCSSEVADRFTVASRYAFHPVFRECARKINSIRRGWDPDADRQVLETALRLGTTFTFKELVDTSGLFARGYRSAVRLLGDGDLRKDLLAPFAPDTICWRDSA